MMVIYFLFFCRPPVHHLFQAVGAVSFRKVEQPRGIEDDQPVFPKEPCALKLPFPQQGAYHPFPQAFQLRCVQSGQELVYCDIVGQELMGLHTQYPAQVFDASILQKFVRHLLHGTDAAYIFHDNGHQHDLCLIRPEFPGVFQFPQPLGKFGEILLHDLAECRKILFVLFLISSAFSSGHSKTPLRKTFS